MRRLIFILLSIPLFVNSQTTIDSYTGSGCGGFTSSSMYSGSTYSYNGQCFDTKGGKYTLTQAKFYMSKTGSPTGNAYAYIYAITGTCGSGGKPTGSALATSDAYDVSTISGTAWVTFTFSSSNQILLSADIYYVAIVSYTGGNSSNYVTNRRCTAANTDDGNISYSSNGSTWSTSTNDAYFQVLGTRLPWGNYLNGIHEPYIVNTVTNYAPGLSDNYDIGEINTVPR